MSGFVGKTFLAAVAAAAGYAFSYLFDRDRGNARRSQLRDQAAATIRRARAAAATQANYSAGKVKGKARTATGAGRPDPQDDVDIVNAIKQSWARLDFATTDVIVDVVDGKAALRGQLTTDEQIRELEKDTEQVPGVRQVDSFLHLPGDPAPNKAAARDSRG